jgi:hypothetical protein
MTIPNPDAEQALENATLALFAELGWQTANGYHEVYGAGPDATLGREHRGQVALVDRLRAALARLNPGKVDVFHLPIDTGGLET